MTMILISWAIALVIAAAASSEGGSGMKKPVSLLLALVMLLSLCACGGEKPASTIFPNSRRFCELTLAMG